MATEPLDSTRNAAAKLDPKLAFFLPNSEAPSIPLTNAKEVRVAWSFSTDDNYAELEQYLTYYTWPTNKDKEQRYVVDPIVGGTPLPGTWRQAFITRIERRGEDRQPEMLVVLTLRRGWAEAIDWTEALATSWKITDGNSTEVSGISNTASFDTAQVLSLRFPNIAPTKVKECIESLPISIIEADNRVVQGLSLTQTWHRAAATATRTEDGSFVIDLLITRNRFTVALYQSFGTPGQRTGYRIYDVPRDQESGITTAWKATGRTADVDLNTSRDLCTVTLWMENETDSNYAYIAATSCAFYVSRTHYDNQAIIPETPANDMGITYTASFQLDRGSGRYNGWIEKQVRQTLYTARHAAASDHDKYAEVEIWRGVYMSGTTYQKAVLSVAAGVIVTTLTTISDIVPSTDAPTEGTVLEWTIRPNDDCTLDVSRGIETERDVAAAGRTTTVDAFTKTVVTVARGQASGGTDITTLDGTKIKLLRWDKDKYGRYSKEERETMPVAADSGWVEYTDRYGSNFYRTFRNQTLAWVKDTGIADMTNATSNSLSISENAHTLYDGVATRQAFSDASGYGTFTRSTREDDRTEVRYRTAEYTDDVLKTKTIRYEKAKFQVRKISAITASYADADNALTAYWALNSGDYADMQMVSEPKAVMVSDPDGHRGIRVEAVFEKPTTDWILRGDAFPT